jgi:hypothetical protein
MKKVIIFTLGLALLVTALVPALTPQAAVAATNSQALCEGSGGTWKADKNAPTGGTCTSADNRTVLGTIQQATDVLLFVTSAIAVLMIIVGGLRYTTSAGDQAAMTGAKNTIMYALIGLVVAVMAYAIVHFIFAAFNIK